MELGEPDASGRRSPVEVPGSEFEIETETVIMSLGTSPNPLIAATTEGLETNRRGCIVANEMGVTSREGVFAGGDADHQLVGVKAVAVGKRASVRNRTKFHGSTSCCKRYYTMIFDITPEGNERLWEK